MDYKIPGGYILRDKLCELFMCKFCLMKIFWSLHNYFLPCPLCTGFSKSKLSFRTQKRCPLYIGICYKLPVIKKFWGFDRNSVFSQKKYPLLRGIHHIRCPLFWGFTVVWSGCQSHCLTMRWKIKFVIFSTNWAAVLLTTTEMLVTGPKIKNDFGNKNIMSKFRRSII